MRRIVEGSAIAALVCFVVCVGLFAVISILPDDMGKGILLTFIGLPLVVMASLVGGFLAAVRTRRVIGIWLSVVAVVVAVLLAAILINPLHGLNAFTSYLIVAGFAAIAVAGGHLSGAAGVPEQAKT
jgi:hypothetical protein